MKKNKIAKLTITLLLVIGIFSFIGTPIVSADSGFDSDYGSSYDSGGSSYDSGGSSYSGDNYSYGGNGVYVSSSDPDVIVIIFLIFFIGLGISLISKSLRTTPDSSSSSQSYSENRDLRLDRARQIPDNITTEALGDINEFLQNRYIDFVDIQIAWMKFDYDTLRAKLTDELFNQYEMQLETLKINDEVNVMTDFAFKGAMITRINNANNNQEVTLEMIVEFYDYIVQNDYVKRGSKNVKKTMHYQMTFTKNNNVNSKTKKVTKCPNCGAILKGQSSEKCEYCGAIITNKSDEWVLTKKGAVRQQ